MGANWKDNRMSIASKPLIRRLALAVLAGALTAAGIASPVLANTPNAPVITSTDFPEGIDAKVPMVGEIGTFTITAADPDIEKYTLEIPGSLYREITLDPLSETVSFKYMPTNPGSKVLTVRALNTAGYSVETDYIFSVTAKDPVGSWTLAEPAGSLQVADANGANLGTVGGGVDLGVDGPGAATAASFNGRAGAFVNTTDTGLLRTNEGFAVSAWVRVDDLSRDQAAVSVKSAEESGFVLGYDSLSATSGEWAFWIPDAKLSPTSEWKASGGSVRIGTADEWVHLTGVYNSIGRSMKLYVNGVEAASTTRGTTWNAGGDVQIGRARAANAWAYQWNGDIAEVQVFDRVVSPDEVAGLGVYKTFGREGYWTFTTASDGLSPEHTGGEAAQMLGDARINTGPEFDEDGLPVGDAPFPLVGDGDLFLDGDGDCATVATPVVDTSGSFSLSVRARLDSTTVANDMAVLSISGQHQSLVEVRFNATTKLWELVLATADAEGAEKVAASRLAPREGNTAGQSLTVVFNGALGEWTLYVNGIESASIEDTTVEAWTATGGIQIGRSLSDGEYGSYFAGAIDDVRVYSGALDARTITLLGSTTSIELPNL